MDKYKISQSPGKKKPTKKTGGPKRRQTRSLDPRMIMSAVVIIMILVLAGLVWARFFNKPATEVTNGQKSSAAQAKANFANVSDSISSKKTSGLSGLYASNVHVVIVGNGTNRTLSASQVNALIDSALKGAKSPWNWHVPASDISAWQQGPYGSYFDGNNIIGESSDGTVVSIIVDDNGQITGVFIAPVDTLTDGGTTTGSSGGGTGGSNTTTGGGGSSDGGGSSGGTTTPTVGNTSD